jgi:hypothetical protein
LTLCFIRFFGLLYDDVLDFVLRVILISGMSADFEFLAVLSILPDFAEGTIFFNIVATIISEKNTINPTEKAKTNGESLKKLDATKIPTPAKINIRMLKIHPRPEAIPFFCYQDYSLFNFCVNKTTI